MTNEQKAIRALVKVTVAVLETLDEKGPAPDSVIYLGLSTIGMSLDNYYQLIGILLQHGYVTREHDLVTVTDKGRAKCRELR